MNNPDTEIFKIDRENDIEKLSRYGEKGISSINNISKSNIPSRFGKEKIVASNYKLSDTPKQFIRFPEQQFNKHLQKKQNEHNFPKLDNLMINTPQYRRYFSYPYYYYYDYNQYNQNPNLDNPNLGECNYLPTERYYKGEIRTKYAGEKDENDIIEAEEFKDVENNSGIENFSTGCKKKNNNLPFFIIICIIIILIFLEKSKSS
jgi:hypothetical protein